MASAWVGSEPPDGTDVDDVAAIRQWIIDDANGYGPEHWDECAGTAIGHLNTLLAALDAERARTAALVAENERLKAELLEAQTEASELTILDIFGTMRQAGVNTKEDLQKMHDEWRAKRNADNGYENPGYRGAVATNGQEVQD